VANIKSAKKRIRVNARQHERNLRYRSRAKTMVNKAEDSIFSDTPSEEAVREAIRTLDKAAVKGIIHKNNAARRKSRLMKKYNQALQASQSA
jgi:small subunit ribosomal protein S20